MNQETKVVLADDVQLRDKAFAIRREVFVVEQKVRPEEEFDEFEDSSRHFVALDSADHPLGAARWRRTTDGIKLERFAVKQSARGDGLGSRLVKSVLEDIVREEGTGQALYLHAQLAAVTLYERFGFKKEGAQFEECNILHYKMTKTS